jgi:hypothetical protein
VVPPQALLLEGQPPSPSLVALLISLGFCDAAGKCRTFPVVFGETGSRFTEALDLAMLKDFAAYMQTDDATHARMPNMIFWCWNANSLEKYPAEEPIPNNNKNEIPKQGPLRSKIAERISSQ